MFTTSSTISAAFLRPRHRSTAIAREELAVSIADTIHSKLTDRFAPARLDVIDESHRHAGHTGARPEGETHFTVTIVSAGFAGLSRVARQRLVYQTLAEELATRVHALSLTALTPEEDRRSLSEARARDGSVTVRPPR
jgi:BolA family transcriptional regulator, general stress-responsive regulator